MKTQRFFLTVLAFGFLSFASATEKPQWEVQTIGSEKIMVYIQPNEASVVEVKLIDKTGISYYYNYSNKTVTDFRKIFDLNQLEDGAYTFKLKVDGLLTEKEFVIADNNIQFETSTETAVPLLTSTEK